MQIMLMNLTQLLIYVEVVVRIQNFSFFIYITCELRPLDYLKKKKMQICGDMCYENFCFEDYEAQSLQ